MHLESVFGLWPGFFRGESFLLATQADLHHCHIWAWAWDDQIARAELCEVKQLEQQIMEASKDEPWTAEMAAWSMLGGKRLRYVQVVGGFE